METRCKRAIVALVFLITAVSGVAQSAKEIAQCLSV